MNKCDHKVFVSYIMLVFLFNSYSACATVRLPQLVSNHMVLQRDMDLKIWGWASPGERVNVRFNGKKENAITGPDNKWMVTYPAMPAGGPYTMNIQGENEIILDDIMIGDVWFCSGQSNMVLPMERLKEKYPDVIDSADYPQIRNFFIPTVSDVSKIYDDLPPGKWLAANPKNVLSFGAASYFFAKQLYNKYYVPIGL